MKQVNDMDRSGLHVTELTSDCLRKIWYGMKLKEMYVNRELTRRQAHIFWLGKKYHEVPVSNVVIKDNGELLILGNDEEYKVEYNEEDGMYYVYDLEGHKLGIYGFELPVEYYGVRGQIDELVMFDNQLTIVDKKTASWIPSAPYPNYVKQVEYYRLMLHYKWGLDAEWGAILFIQKPNVQTKREFMTKAYKWKIRPIEEIEEEFKAKVDAINEYLRNDELPPANPNKTDCKFCQWKDLCKANSKEVDVVKKKEKKHVVDKDLLDFDWMSKRK